MNIPLVRYRMNGQIKMHRTMQHRWEIVRESCGGRNPHSIPGVSSPTSGLKPVSPLESFGIEACPCFAESSASRFSLLVSQLALRTLGNCHPTDVAECQHHVLTFLPLLPGLKDKYSEGRKRQDTNTYIRTFSEAGWVAKWEECEECPRWFSVKPDPSEHPQHN